ncbi:MAG: NAD-dependent epimerase/dehydratase family protein [Desulfovibrio sp.]|jgi:UDP-glucose 4-epimerase|nr:NAD-dependent epimerase/dehydratase family protein [Desulfovibrio sp.]
MGHYLVTGLAGFIGSALGRALLERGHFLTGIDNLSTGFMENVPAGAEFFRGDCGREESYAGLLPKHPYDAIFHIAGQSSGEVSFDDPLYDLRTNTASTLHLLRFAQICGCKRIVYASSMSVYGEQPDAPTSEDAPCRPLSFYGVGKLASEHYLRIYEQYGIASTALRLFNVYGPGQNMGNMRQGMVSIYMSMLAEGTIRVKGRPDRYRDFVYIDDVVRAFLNCLEHKESEGRVLNIGGSGKVLVRELLDMLLTVSADPARVEYGGGTPGDMFGIYADGELAGRCLGYKPQFGLKSGLTAMYAWHKGRSAL